MADTVDGVEVKLGADTSAATAGVADASSSIADSLKAINSTLQNFGQTNKFTTEQAIRNNADLSRSFLELKASATGGFNGIVGVIERFRGVLATLTTALAGGLIGKEAVASLLSLEAGVRKLEIVFGMTAAKATETSIALRLAGVDVDTYAQMVQRMGMRLRAQPEEFQRLGVAIKDANGALLPADTILQNVYKRMQDFKAGTDQDLFAMDLLGRRAIDFASDMQRLEAAQARATEVMRQFGIQMGPSQQEQIEQYRQDMNAFKIGLEAIGEKIGEALLPRLMAMAEWIGQYLPAAIGLVIGALDKLSIAFQIIKVTILTLWDVLTDTVKLLYDFSDALYQSGRAALGLSNNMGEAWKKLEADAKASAHEVAAVWVDAADEITKALMRTATPMEDAWGGEARGASARGRGAGALPGSGKEGFTGKPKGGAEDNLSALQNELKAEQDAYNNRMLAQGSFEIWSETQTRDYWEEVLSMSTLSAKQRVEAENQYYAADRKLQVEAFAAHIAQLREEEAEQGHNITAKIAIAQREYNDTLQRFGATDAKTSEAYKHLVELRQQLAAQRERIADEEQKRDEELAKFAISMDKMAADQAVAMRQISSEQRLAVEREFITKEYALEIEGLRNRIALMAQDPTADPAKLQELKNQLLSIEQNYQKQLTALDNAAEKERAQDAITAANDIQNAFANLFDQLTQKPRSVTQAFKDMARSIDQDLTKIASNDVAKQLFGAGTTGGNFLTGITSKIFGGGAAGGGAGASGANAAMTQLATTTTLTNTDFTTMNPLLTELNAAFVTLTSAATQAASALSSTGAGGLGGGGGGGLESIFSSIGGMSDMVGFESGTPYVPQTSLAIVHRGERIIPASQNTTSYGSMNTTFMVNGPIDTRTQTQIARSMALAANRARNRG